LIGGNLIAVDGTKIKASNNKKTNFSRKKLEDRLNRIDAQIETYLSEIEQTDRSEERSKSVMPRSLEELNKRKELYESYINQLDETGENEISEVDLDARLMGNNRGGVDMAYNVQSAVDGENHIHQNPLKAKLCSNINSYKWSSYDNYINQNGILDCEYVLSCFSDDKSKAVEQFIDYHKEITYEKCLEIEDANFRLTDDELRKLMKKICGTNNIMDFQIMDIKKRDKTIIKLKAKGMSIRQISRLTGISFGIVRKL